MPPGLSEYLGVVRSALHVPLYELVNKKFITERKAHVIGGGSRKRKVYHITEAGRAECEGIEVPSVKKVGITGSLQAKLSCRQRFSDSRFEGQKELFDWITRYW